MLLVVCPALAFAQPLRVQARYGDTVRVRTTGGWRAGVLEFAPGDYLALVQQQGYAHVGREGILDLQVQRGTRPGPRFAPLIGGVFGLAICAAGSMFLFAYADTDMGIRGMAIPTAISLLGLAGGVAVGRSVAATRRPLWVPASPP